MNELLSALIVSIYTAALSLGGSPASHTYADAKVTALGEAEMKVDARIAFKRIENQSNTDYKAAIADCKKRPSAERPACVEDAQAVNDKEIFAAKMSLDKAMAEARATGTPATLEARSNSGMLGDYGVRFLPASAAAPLSRAEGRLEQ